MSILRFSVSAARRDASSQARYIYSHRTLKRSVRERGLRLDPLRSAAHPA
jgi:hypothetical protein